MPEARVKALTFQGVGDIRYGETPDPRLVDEHDAIVRVELAGLCGSDLHVYHGREVGIDPGTVMGHEFVGRVHEVGAAVRGLAPGVRVACPFTTSCGACYFCLLGLSARCVSGHSVDERLARAAALGASPVDSRRDDPIAIIHRDTDGRGVDAVLEAVGSPQASHLAFDLVRPGGIISAVGVHHEAAFPFSPAQAYDRNLTWRIGRCPARSLMEGLLPLVRRRRRDLAALITHRVALADGRGAYAMFDAKRDGCIKVAFVP